MLAATIHLEAARTVAAHVQQGLTTLPPTQSPEDWTLELLHRYWLARAIHTFVSPGLTKELPADELAQSIEQAVALGYRVATEPPAFDGNSPEARILRDIQKCAQTIFCQMGNSASASSQELMRAVVLAYREAGEALCELAPGNEEAQRQFNTMLNAMEAALASNAPPPYNPFAAFGAFAQFGFVTCGIPRRFQQTHLRLVPNT